MKLRIITISTLFLGFIFLFQTPLLARKRDTLSAVSIQFVENKKQWNENVLFSTKLFNGTLFFEKNCVTFAILHDQQLNAFREAKRDATIIPSPYIDAVAYKTHFVGANPDAKVSGNGEWPFYHNYYLGNDPQKWSPHVKVFQNIYYDEIYEGIDLQYYQKDSYLKYEFIVAPGYLPQRIEIEYEGVKSLSLADQNLVVQTAVGNFLELRPYSYQILPDGDTIQIACRYKLNRNSVTFELGDYNKLLPLVIDPTLIFSSYSGSTADNWGFTATYDLHGNTYAGGIAFNIGYPTTVGAYQTHYAGDMTDITISKFSPDGSTLIYSTYLGGANTEVPNSLVVNENNELYMLGTSSSQNYPITSGAFQNRLKGGNSVIISSSLAFTNGSDIVITKFDATGQQLLASTFVGGIENDGLNLSPYLFKNYADESRGEIMVDNQSNVYVVSSTCSSDFPVVGNVFQPQFGGGLQDACIIKMNHNLTNMIWSSFLGGSGDDAGYSIDICEDGAIYIAGGTNSSNFPVTPNSVQTLFGGGAASLEPDGFVANIDEFGTQLLHSTYLGSSAYDQIYMVKTDRQGFPHVFGQTLAQGNFWISNAAWNTPGGGQFVTKLNRELNAIVWSTAFGKATNKPDISPTAFMVDVCNNIYMSGWGSPSVCSDLAGTTGLPVTSDAIQLTTDNNDCYLICLANDASSLLYATFFGSPTRGDHVDGGTSRFDKKGAVYQAVCAGCGGVQNFPTTPGAWSRTNGSTNCNIAVFKIDFEVSAVIADFVMPNTVCAPVTINFDNTSQLLGATSTCFWNFGDGSTSTQKFPSHTYTTSGTYEVMLVVKDPNSCNGSDTIVKPIVVLANTLNTLPTIYQCDNQPVQIGFPPGQDAELTYRWEPTTGLSNPNISNPIANPNESTTYTLYVSNQVCFDTVVVTIEIVNIEILLDAHVVICPGDSILIQPVVNSSADLFYWSTSPSFSSIINTDTSTPDITLNPTTTTTYYLKVVHGGCTAIVSITVEVPNLSLNLPDTLKICPNEQAVITAQYLCGNCTFNWRSTPSIVAGYQTNTITVAPLTNTWYFLEMVDESSGCVLTDSTFVLLHEDLFTLGLTAWADENFVTQGDTTILHSTIYNRDFTYQWSPTTGVATPQAHSSILRPESSIIYTVLVTDPNGCQRSDTVFVFVETLFCGDPYVFVPNAFTPNYDGLNDILYVRSNIIDQMIFRIYDRWGEQVFESTHPEHGWDGTWKGKEAPAGVYDYYLEVRCIGSRTYITKGNVTLIR